LGWKNWETFFMFWVQRRLGHISGMVRTARSSTVEVVAPDGTKSFWVVALPHSEAVGAVRKVIPTDHRAELSMQRFQSGHKLLQPGEVRKIEK
jgi:hypothetical protein